MGRIFKSILVVVIIVGVILAIFYFSNSKPTKVQTMQDLVNDVSLDNMRKNIRDQVEVHKKYILQLRGMNSEIKTIGAQLEKKMDLAKAFGKVGDQYIKEEFLPIALANYSMGLELFPQDPVLNYKKGLILANYGTYYPDKQRTYYKEAEKFYKTSIHISQDYAEPHYSLALLYFICAEQKINMGSLSEALTEVNIYLDTTSSKKNVDAYFLKARIAYALEDTNTALQSYQTILNMTRVGSEVYNKAKNNIMQLSGSM